MKRILIISALVILALCALCVCLAEEPVYEFALNEDGEGYTLTGMTGTSSSSLLDLPDTYEQLPVTAIGAGAFKGIRISQITIPDSVKYIAEEAFADTSTQRILLPNTKVTVADSAFKNAYFSEFKIPAYADQALLDAISQSRGIFRLYLSQDTTAYTIIGNVLYTSDLTRLCLGGYDLDNYYIDVPETVTTISKRAFRLMPNSIKLMFGAQVTTIEDQAFLFDGASNSVTVYAPKNSLVAQTARQYVMSVNEYEHINMPEVTLELTDSNTYKVKKVTNYFKQNVEIPSFANGIPITEVAERAFESCWLDTLVLNEGIKNIAAYAFSRSSIKNLTLPNSLLSIEDNAFEYFKGSPIKLSGNLQTIGKNAFLFCNIETCTFILPDSVRSIGESAFLYAVFDELVLPDSITEIDKAWFMSSGTYSKPLYPISVSAQHPTYKSIGGVLYSRDGKILYFYPGSLPETEFVVPEGVTRIAEDAFAGVKLDYVVLSDTVTTIDAYSFNNSAIKAIYTGASLETIGEHAFYNCRKLENIEFECVKTIGEYAFWGCSSLKYIVLPSTVTYMAPKIMDYGMIYGFGGYVEQYAVEYRLTYTALNPGESDGLLFRAYAEKGVLEYAVVGMTDTRSSITIPAAHNGINVTFIDQGAFSGATWLTKVTISAQIVLIAPEAFSGCTALASISLPSSLMYIGDFAFFGCDKLTSVTIPKSVYYVGAGAFADCEKLRSFSVASGNKQFKALSGALYSADGSILFAYPAGADYQNYTLGSVKLIAPYAFYGSGKLKIVSFTGATEIGAYAFGFCSSLTKATFSENLLTLGEFAFAGCEAMTEFTINKNLTNIGACAFLGCTSLSSFKLESGDTNHKLLNGALFNAELSAFLLCPPALPAKRFELPDSVKEIGKYAFAGCMELESVTMGKNALIIREGAFTMCVKLNDVTLPPSIIMIEEDIFLGCPLSMRVHCEYLSKAALYAENVGANCEYSYCTIAVLPGITDVYLKVGESLRIIAPDFSGNGYGYDYNYTVHNNKYDYLTATREGTSRIMLQGNVMHELTLHIYDDDGVIVIGEHTTRVESEAFAGNTNIKRVRIPDSVTYIAEDAFSGILPPTIMCSIGSYAETYARAHGFAVLYTG